MYALLPGALFSAGLEFDVVVDVVAFETRDVERDIRLFEERTRHHLGPDPLLDRRSPHLPGIHLPVHQIYVPEDPKCPELGMRRLVAYPGTRRSEALALKWSDINATTMNIYSHVTPTMQRSAVDRFAAHLGNAEHFF